MAGVPKSVCIVTALDSALKSLEMMKTAMAWLEGIGGTDFKDEIKYPLYFSLNDRGKEDIHHQLMKCCLHLLKTQEETKLNELTSFGFLNRDDFIQFNKVMLSKKLNVNSFLFEGQQC